ncbi:hypothetical protein DPMN_034813 [Dreissena polymorpha]|uniref:Conotoxin n=1 Tax=Dreissena polymorpha TaxID=45954 RepID=A0A9D4RK23_DREPO|nr:hypothetical protein DPMN_034813 [Dreissena polymorpha]
MERFMMVWLFIVCLTGSIGYTNSLPINDALVNNDIRSNSADLKFLVERTLNRKKRNLPLCPTAFPNCCIFFGVAVVVNDDDEEEEQEEDDDDDGGGGSSDDDDDDFDYDNEI